MGSPEGPAQGHQARRAGIGLRRPHHPVHQKLREGVRVQVEQRRLRGVPVQLPHQRGGAGGVNGQCYDLPAWFISMLPDCKTAVFNTAMVSEPLVPARMTPVGGFSWQSYSEATNALDDCAFTKDGLVDQLNMTWDKSDYLCVNINSNEQFLKSRQWPQLTINSAGHALQAWSFF